MSQPVSDQEFAQSLSQSGIVSDDVVRQAHNFLELAKSRGLSVSLAETLVQDGVITDDIRVNIEKKILAARRGAVRQLGPYKLLKKIGEGGMGAVYLTEDEILGRRAALKVLRPELVSNPEFLARFRREARAAGHLNHPNIVSAYTVGEESGHHFLAMEYVDGEPLDKLLSHMGAVPWLKAVEITAQIAQGLKHAHAHGILHRDIKPANIFLGSDGLAKILDLGLSKDTTDNNSGHTTEHAAVGTPFYISPEQARGEKNVDGRTDIYGLGATLYHLVTGKPPFDGPTAMVIMTKHVIETLPDPRLIRPELPAALVGVINKMMGKTPGERYAHCDHLLTDLGHLQTGHVLEHAELPPPIHLPGDPDPALIGSRSRMHAAKKSGLTAKPPSNLPGTPSVGGTSPKESEPLHALEAPSATEPDPNLIGSRNRMAAAAAAAARLTAPGEPDPALSGSRTRMNAPKRSGINKPVGDVRPPTVTRSVGVGNSTTKQKLLQFGRRARQSSGVRAQLLYIIGGGAAAIILVLLYLIFTGQNVPDNPAPLPVKVPPKTGTESPDLTAPKDPRLLPGVGPGNSVTAYPGPPPATNPAALNDPALNGPVNDAWVKAVLALNADQQARQVFKKLVEMNPGLDDKSFQYRVEAGQVVDISLSGKKLGNIAPLRALKRLQKFNDTNGDWQNRSTFKDLSPLMNLPLENLHIFSSGVDDLSVLRNLPLKILDIGGCWNVMDITPLRGLRLEQLRISSTQVKNLEPLAGMPLKELWLAWTKGTNWDLNQLRGLPLETLRLEETGTADLGPLHDLKLRTLNISKTQVKDLSPLAEMYSLTTLDIHETPVNDLSPLANLNLNSIELSPRSISHGWDVLRKMKDLKNVTVSGNGYWAKDFWRRYDADEFR